MLRILCFSDLHRDADAAKRLVQRAADADLVIGAGDFANRREGLEDTLDILAAIDKPAVLVPGNGESVEQLRDAASAWQTAKVLHGSGCELVGKQIWGVGGGIPVTPFGDWSYDFDESEAERLLSGCSEGAILVVHSPPIDTVDHDTNGQIRGSHAIRSVIEQRKPCLVVCGHIHSDWGKQVDLEGTKILNAGPTGVIVELSADADLAV